MYMRSRPSLGVPGCCWNVLGRVISYSLWNGHPRGAQHAPKGHQAPQRDAKSRQWVPEGPRKSPQRRQEVTKGTQGNLNGYPKPPKGHRRKQDIINIFLAKRPQNGDEFDASWDPTQQLREPKRATMNPKESPRQPKETPRANKGTPKGPHESPSRRHKAAKGTHRDHTGRPKLPKEYP